MRHRPAAAATSALHADLLQRWDRIGLGVRCAYHPACPQVIHHYLEAGRRVAVGGARSEAQVQRRILAVLLQTSRDAALPWFWRSVCLEHTAYPLARLQSLLRHDDPLAFDAMLCAVQAAHDELGAPPRSAAPRLL